jgi:imidazolonepropionase-like amidohydrolase
LVNAGIDCIEHGTGLTGDVLEEMARRGTALVPTLVNIETFPDIADSATKYPAYAKHMRALHAGVKDMVGAAVAAGVRVYAGTDAGGSIRHGETAAEVMALAAAGLSPTAALGAASWEARKWLGWQGLTEGAPADVVAYAEDPRQNLSILRSPSRILLRGRVVA